MHQETVHSLLRWMHGPRSGRVPKWIHCSGQWCVKKKKKRKQSLGIGRALKLRKKGKGVDWLCSARRGQYWLEGLKVKLRYFGYLMWRADSLEKTLMLGKVEGRTRGDNRGWDGWVASLTQWTWVWASSGRWWWTGRPGVLQSMGSQRVGTRLSNWTTEVVKFPGIIMKLLM